MSPELKTRLTLAQKSVKLKVDTYRYFLTSLILEASDVFMVMLFLTKAHLILHGVTIAKFKCAVHSYSSQRRLPHITKLKCRRPDIEFGFIEFAVYKF